MTRTTPNNGSNESRLREDGYRATAPELRRSLSSAPPEYLQGAMANPRMGPDLVVFLLRNRAVPQDILVRISRNPSWTRRYEVKKGLAAHPGTPLPIARLMVNHLYWKDLREVADNLRINPVVRKAAEELLKVRLESMTLGERISLARNATRGLIEPLRDIGEVEVLTALLGNPRLVENDVVWMAGNEESPGELLELLSNHPVWGRRFPIRLALLENRRTPVHAAMRVLSRLPRQDLRRLKADSRVPRIVRVGAERHLSRIGRRSSGTASLDR
jgi:hypothetical protein